MLINGIELIVHLAYCFSWTISKEVSMNFDHEENQGYKQCSDLSDMKVYTVNYLEKFQLYCHDLHKESFNQKVWPSNAPHVFYVISSEKVGRSIIIFLNHFSIWEHVRFTLLITFLKISLKLGTFLWFDTGVLSIKSSNYDTKCFQEIRRRKMFFKKEDISLEPAKIKY